MELDAVTKSLHPLEIKVLLRYKKGETVTPAGLARDLSYNTGHSNQATSWLLSKGLIVVTSQATKISYELTELGKEFLEKGTPEARQRGRSLSPRSPRRSRSRTGTSGPRSALSPGRGCSRWMGTRTQ
jgi:predicted transcriptional regulator